MSILKEFRKKNLLTQMELAEFLEIQQGFVSQIEKGERPLPKNIISKILANQKNWDTSMFNSKEEEKRSSSDAEGVVELLKQQNAELQEKIDKLNREIGELTALLKSEQRKNAQLAESSSSANVG